jgi:hypothetical protein
VTITLDSAAGMPSTLDFAATPSDGDAVEESGVAITQEYAARTPLHWTPYQLHPMVMQ